MSTELIDKVPMNLREAEVFIICEALRRSRRKVDAALLLGITRHALLRKVTKHGIDAAHLLAQTVVAPQVQPVDYSDAPEWRGYFGQG